MQSFEELRAQFAAAATSNQSPNGQSELAFDSSLFTKKAAAYFFPSRHCYCLAETDGCYQIRSITEFRRDLRQVYQIPKKLHDPIITYIDHNRVVDYVGPIAGHRAGLHFFNNKRLLVTKGPILIEARPGDWPLLQSIFDSMLPSDQRPYFYGWLKVGRQALLEQNLRPAQSLVLCGPKNSGKSFTQEFVITALLGGRVARPYSWMSGATSFNSDLIGAEHWQLDDEAAPEDFKVRRAIAAQIKQIASSQVIWSHKKGEEATALPVFRRLTISCNEDDHSLSVLPPLDETLESKVILCHTQNSTLLWPATNRERQQLIMKAQSEFSAFADFLDHYEIPSGLTDQRYGIRGFLNPLISAAVNRLGPDFELLDLTRRAITKSSKGTVFPYEATAGQLFDLIYGCEELRAGLLRITAYPKGLGRILSSLVNREIPGIRRRILDGRALYELDPE
jgi:hypothetical protein